MTKYPGLTKEEVEIIRGRNISKAKKGVPVPEERRRRISESEKGKYVSPETCRKISEARKKRTVVTNKETGEVLEFASQQEAVQTLGFRSPIAYILNKHKGHYKQYFIECP